MSSCPVVTNCDMVTDESSLWQYRSNCTSCWNDRDAVITGSVPSQGSWPLIGRECMACVRIDPSCIKLHCCDRILDYTQCFVNDGTVFARIWLPVFAALLLVVFVTAFMTRKRILLLYRCCDFRVIPGYFTCVFFVFAIAARRSVQQTCHHLNQSSCDGETTLNYIIVVISIIFVMYIAYWIRHSYRKDARPFYLRDVELQSSLYNTHNNINGHNGRAHATINSILGTSSSSRSHDDDDDESPHFPRTRTSTAVDFGVTVDTTSGSSSSSSSGTTSSSGSSSRKSRNDHREQYMTLNPNSDASLLGL